MLRQVGLTVAGGAERRGDGASWLLVLECHHTLWCRRATLLVSIASGYARFQRAPPQARTPAFVGRRDLILGLCAPSEFFAPLAVSPTRTSYKLGSALNFRNSLQPPNFVGRFIESPSHDAVQLGARVAIPRPAVTGVA